MIDFEKFISEPDYFELSFYESLLEKHPDFTEALFPLADLYTKLGYYEKGLKADLQLSVLYPKDNAVWYNLCCSYSLCGKTDEALQALEKSVELGWNDIENMENDTDLDNIKPTKKYKQIYKALLKKYRK